MDFSPDPRDNHRLATLPDAELRCLAPQLHQMTLQPGQVLYESGSTISHAYFPTTALVATLYEFSDGTSAETAIIGNEGMVGIAAFMGGDSRLGRAVVLSAGRAFRLGAQALKDEFQQTGPLMVRVNLDENSASIRMRRTAGPGGGGRSPEPSRPRARRSGPPLGPRRWSRWIGYGAGISFSRACPCPDDTSTTTR